MATRPCNGEGPPAPPGITRRDQGLAAGARARPARGGSEGPRAHVGARRPAPREAGRRFVRSAPHTSSSSTQGRGPDARSSCGISSERSMSGLPLASAVRSAPSNSRAQTSFGTAARTSTSSPGASSGNPDPGGARKATSSQRVAGGAVRVRRRFGQPERPVVVGVDELPVVAVRQRLAVVGGPDPHHRRTPPDSQNCGRSWAATRRTVPTLRSAPHIVRRHRSTGQPPRSVPSRTGNPAACARRWQPGHTATRASGSSSPTRSYVRWCTSASPSGTATPHASQFPSARARISARFRAQAALPR